MCTDILLFSCKPVPPLTKLQFLHKKTALDCCYSKANTHRTLMEKQRKWPKPIRRSMKVCAFGIGEGDSITGNFLPSVFTVAVAVANRVLYKLALVPMKKYPFFLAQVTSFGYVVIYFSILCIRYHAGVVTKDMLLLPKSNFMAIGLLDSLGLALGMAAGAMLPGPAIPVLSQTFLVWQLFFSTLILGRKYSPKQIIGCILVAAGVAVAVTSGQNEGQLLHKVEFIWPCVMMVSAACHSGASILKEYVFIDSARRLKGKSLDLFVVNSFSSGFQALFAFLLLPFFSSFKGISFLELPTYLRSGVACFINVGSRISGKILSGCEGAPLLPLLYIAANMAFNTSVLNLVKNSSAVVASLTVTLSVPLSIYILSFPLPCIPQAARLTSSFVVGTIVLVLGLILYNLPRISEQASKRI
ncbi:protein CLT2, chloroplastic isoform X1 [Amborella trichopoda]|uniref:protein CLT2, chloroplastic isoform X1 n=1 Tax=Amborella trichopoda TaxID=13333 RepID=UPI0009C01CD4|nr:protein CLT2, chloroplastic isoform X1 [Amborella trichopoda]XP_020528010.1 protein CLT2, chloroplastic isoform X1 [Amborella trichopoda]XP_020528012.1 protein CLT2, chloroplastic isoform X1 [Amborella trichopoda]|eukprot:XP_020528009.1 protein CLT2, chloroplastic isoform X1 [Amborella trichopoda]